MQEWFKASELVYFVGVPKSATAILRKASNEDWQSRPATGKGGGKEYHISSLPEITRAAIAKKFMAENPPKPAPYVTQQRVTAIVGLPQKNINQIDARLEILRLFENFHILIRTDKKRALFLFCEDYNSQQVVVTEGVREVVKTVAVRTIERWLKTRNEGNIAALASGHGKHRKGTGVLDGPEINELIKGMLCDKPHTSASNLHRALFTRFGSVIPTTRTVERWLDKWKQKNAYMFGLWANPDAHKSKYMVAFGNRSANIQYVNQMWELDSTPADVLTTDGRYSIIGAIDIFSRRVKVVISKSSTAESVCQLVRESICDWGVPESIKTDNGADYKSKHFTKAMARLGVWQDFADPFSGDQKPHIERFFHTMSRQLFEFMPGYIGHDVADRKAIEARRAMGQRLGQGIEKAFSVELSAEELQQQCNDWIDNIYSFQKHSSINISPFEKAQSCIRPIERITDIRSLSLMLSESFVRTITKEGIKLENAHFIAPELGAYVGQEVSITKDPDDMGKIVVNDLEEGTFICLAECPERTGVSPQQIAQSAKRIQNERNKQIRAIGRKAKATAKPHNILDELQAKGALHADSVTALPKAEQEYVNSSIDAAHEAIMAGQAPKARELTPQEQKTHEKVVVSLSDHRNPQPNNEDSSEARFARWQKLDLSLENGEKVSAVDQQWHAGYPNTPEWKASNQMLTLFGKQTNNNLGE